MQIKRNNILFMIVALLLLLLTSVMSIVCNAIGVSGWGLDEIICYLIFIGIGLLMLRKDEATFFDVLPFNVGLKPLTALLIVALAFLLIPLTGFLSSVGGLVNGNVMNDLMRAESAKETGFFEAFFTMAVLPAVFEEIFFRGFFYAGFKRARGARLAIILSSILFGFFHGILQQVIYASVLGIVLAILREVTGSMWAGCLYHLVNNGYTIIRMKLIPEDIAAKLPYSHLYYFMKDGKTAGNLILAYSILLVTLALGGIVLRLIIKREGRLEDAKHFFKRPDDPKEKLVTVPFVIGCVAFALLTVAMVVWGKDFAATSLAQVGLK